MKIQTPVLELGLDEDHRIPKNSDYEAWCCSVKCAGPNYQIVLAKKENAPPKAIYCQDCGYALQWKKKESLESGT